MGKRFENVFSDPENKEFQKVVDSLNAGTRPILIHGEAGTGKSTFIRELSAFCAANDMKTMAVAFTNLAARGIGGRTIHSSFGLALRPYLPHEDTFETLKEGYVKEYKERAARRKMKEKNSNSSKLVSLGINFDDIESLIPGFRSITPTPFRKMDILFIDEISMVRCDTIDAIDQILRFCTEVDAPFGGKQVVMLGDTAQLPPVVKESDRQVLEHAYKDPFTVFHSRVFQESDLLTVELSKVYRQKDKKFLTLLRGIRLNGLMPKTIKALNERLVEQFDIEDLNVEDQIICATNARCSHYNAQFLNAIKGGASTYEAVVVDDYPERDFPVPRILDLKLGAKVMIVANNNSVGYYNGMIGQIRELHHDSAIVEVDNQEYRVDRYEWENRRSFFDKNRNRVTTEVVGTFKQLPLKLAYAMTTHKAQGKTYERILCDFTDEFLPENTYVALSRCTSLEGVTILSRLSGDQSS